MQAVATHLHFRAPPGGYSYRGFQLFIMQSRTFIYLTARAEENAMMLCQGHKKEEKDSVMRAGRVSGMHRNTSSRIIIA